LTDIVTPEQRSRMMGRIRGRDTQAELLVRRYLHRAGLRFLVNDRRLPGSPDLVIPRYKAAIFVHGCFWHRHEDCRFATNPSTRVDFWQAKFAANVARDRAANAELCKLGWRPFVIWECEVQDADHLDRHFWEIVAI
jgi:DNA mismatch endonuclease (patch repair protein)